MLTDTRVRRGSFAVLYRVVALVPRAFRSTQLSTRAGVATTVSNVYRIGLKSHDSSGTCRGTVVHGMLGSRVGSTTAYVLYTVPAQAVFLGLHRSFDIHTAGMGEPHRLRHML